MKKYCVIQLGGLSDILLSKRLLLSLKVEQAEVTLCVDAGLQKAAALVYPDINVYGLSSEGSGITDNAKLFDELKKTAFDCIFNLSTTPQAKCFASFLEGAELRGCWKKQGREYCSEWMKLCSRLDGRKIFMNRMDQWAHLADSPVPSHTVNPIAMRKGRGIGVVLRDSNDDMLPLETLAGCINAVCTGTRENDVVVLGDEQDSGVFSELIGLLKEKISANAEFYKLGENFEEDISVISSVNMLLTPESSAMHLAAHLGVPVNAFFHEVAWAMETGPYGLGHRVWQADENEEEATAVFSDKQFQRFLGGKIDQNYPQGVIGYVSMLDEVGVTYMPVFGEEPLATERLSLRGLASEYLGIAKVSKTVGSYTGKSLYAPADWIFINSLEENGEEYE